MRGENHKILQLSPVLDEMLQIIDASYVSNGEVQMDYGRFRVLHRQAREGLGRLGIQLPNLNEGGNATRFNRELRRIAHHARIGDYSGAKRRPVPQPVSPPIQRQHQPTRVIVQEHRPSWWQVVLGQFLQNLAGRLVFFGVLAVVLWLAVQCVGES